MEYGLLSTEASFAFLIVLTLVYFGKQQYKSGRTTCYKVYVIISMIYQLLFFLSIVLIKYFDLTIITKYIWRFQYILMFASWKI